METITFPILNLELTINKIAFTIYGIPIYWYAIIIVSSLILALILFKRKNNTFGIKYEDILDLSIILIPISFICARAYYVIFNIKAYNNLQEILNIKDGGLAIYGGIIGGLITSYIFCKKRKINLLDLTDYIVPILALGQSIGRWGNFINVEAYGYETNLSWKMGIQKNGITKYVHPTFLYESIATFAIFIILNQISKKRKYKGEITYLYIITYSAVRFIIEGLRTDSLMLGNIRISQAVSLILLILATIKIMLIKLQNQEKSGKIEI